MAKTHHSNYLIWTLMFVGVAGLFVGVSTSSSVFAFEINPLSFGGNIELPDILCNAKASVSGIDASGKTVLSTESSAFERHPKTQFSLIGGSDNSEVTKFKIENKMRCDFINGASFVDMTVAQSDLTTVIYAKDSNGVEKNVWNNSVRNTSDVPIVNNSEEILSTTTANTVDIHKYLEAGDYSTTLRIVTYGTVDIFYDVVPSVEYEVAIPDNKIVAYIDLDVQKDTPTNPVPPTPPTEPPVDDPPTDPTIIPQGLIEEMVSCMQSFDFECLSQEKFLPYFIGGFGGIFLLGAVTTRKQPMFDQLGNRIN